MNVKLMKLNILFVFLALLLASCSDQDEGVNTTFIIQQEWPSKINESFPIIEIDEFVLLIKEISTPP